MKRTIGLAGRIAADLEVPLDATCFMGDDVNDLPALALCALPACPSDAVPEVLRPYMGGLERVTAS